MTQKDERYQILPENFFDIMKRRKLRAEEAFFAIYLRGKYCRFDNPFKCHDFYITQETGLSYKVISKLRKRLQVKGVIKFDTFHGRGHATIYTMLDTYMTPPRKGKPTRMGKKTYPNEQVLISQNQAQKPAQTGNLISNNKEKNNSDISLMPKSWREETLRLIKTGGVK